VTSCLQVCAVKAPGFGDNRKASLQDMAILTGGTVVSDELGLKLENVELSHLGRVKKITVTKDDTIMLDGQGERSAIEERCSVLRDTIENTSSEYEKEKLQERLAKLSGGVAVIKVGGASEVEVNEKKDRLTDALNATRAAVEEGIVAGGGSALLYATRGLDAVREAADNFDQGVGVGIVQRAIQEPCRTIANNAGAEGSVIVGRLLEAGDATLGYDAATGNTVNMVNQGIIDPLKVVRTALVDSCSVASLLSTTECMVVDHPAKDGGAAPGGMPGGMGGMGGMGDMF